MKKKKMNVKALSIDEYCGSQPGSFKKFLRKKEEYAKQLELRRKARIQAARPAQELAWVA